MNIFNGEIVSMLLFFIGLLGLMTQKSILKTIISLCILEAAVILFFLTINFSVDRIPPIGTQDTSLFADPLPQALMITTIVIGVAVTAVAITMFMHYKQKTNSTHWPNKKNTEQEYDSTYHDF